MNRILTVLQLYYPMLALGIIAAGGVFTGMNPSYTPFEISHHVNTVHGKFVVTEPDMLKNVLDAKHDIPKERVFIFDNHGEDIPKGFKSYKSLMDHGEADWYVAVHSNQIMLFKHQTIFE